MHLIAWPCLRGCYFGRVLRTQQSPEKEKREKADKGGVGGGAGLPGVFFQGAVEKQASTVVLSSLAKKHVLNSP